MPPLQVAFSAATVLLVAAVVVGLVRRRLHRLCYVFPIYLVAVGVGELLYLAKPSVFYQLTFWRIKETVYSVLKLGLALELGALAFQAFPGARLTARRLGVAVLLLTLVLFLLPAPAATHAFSLVDLQARLTNGTAFFFAAIWAVALWYYIPLHHLHRAILRGLLLYLMVFTVAQRAVVAVGWDVRPLLAAVDGAAYLGVLGYWVWESWRTPPTYPGHEELLRRLQPWRDRL